MNATHVLPTGDEQLSPVRLKLVTWLVTGALFMEILDGAIIAPALPAMARAFHTTALQLNVGISAYLLSVGIFIPASGWIADRYGSRRVFMLAIALFTLSSASCGSATTLWSFVAMRAVQGFSGALMVPVGRLVILKFTAKDQLMAAMSSLVWPALVAPVLGPPLGGLITLHLGWHWIFFLNLPLGVGALATARRIVPDVREANLRPFDWPGFLLCGTGTFLLLFGLDQLAVAVCAINLEICGAGVFLIILAVLHFRCASNPMLRLAVLRVPTFRAILRGGSLARIAIGSTPFLLTLMFQVGFAYDPFKAGWLVLILFAGNLAMKTLTTAILRRLGYRTVLVWNGLLAAASLASCATMRPDSSLVWIAAVLLANGMTRSMQFTALGTVSFADVRKEDMSDANGLSNTVGQLTMAAGITLAAMAVYLGQSLVPASAPTFRSYQIAFGCMAAIALLSVLEMALLPKGAGDHFIQRK
jgi:MFS family permease